MKPSVMRGKLGQPLAPAIFGPTQGELAIGNASERGAGEHLGYQPGLDGLRAVFVAWVLLFHSGVSWAVGGYLGVSGFFALSGFLICTLLLEERAAHGRVDLRRFAARRVRRLLPAAWVGIGVALVYGATLAPDPVLRAMPGDAIASLAYVVNWRFILAGASYEALFAEPSPLTHLWSLAIEGQYYVVFPLVLVGLHSLARGRALVMGLVIAGLALASTVWMAVLFDPTADTARVYYGTDTRAAELLVGAVFAVGWWSLRRRREGRDLPVAAVRALDAVAVAALVALTYAAATVEQPTDGLYQGGLALHALLVLPVLAASLVPGAVRRVLALEPLRLVGLVSYGIYLYHWPIFLALTPGRTGLEGWTLFAVRTAATLAAATLSYHLVERPFRDRRVITTNVLRITAPLAALAVVVGALTLPDPAPDRFVVAEGETTVDWSDLEELEEATPVVPDAPVVTVVGDSTSLRLDYGMHVVAASTGAVEMSPGWAGIGCSLVSEGLYRSEGAEYGVRDNCVDWPGQWRNLLASNDTDVAVVLMGVWDISDHLLPGDTVWRGPGDPVYDEVLARYIRDAMAVLAEEAEVVVWLTIPQIELGLGLPVRPPADPASDPARGERMNELVREQAATFPDGTVEVVDLRGWFDALPGGPLDPSIRPDGVHLSETSAPVVAEWVVDEVLEIWIDRANAAAD